MTTNEIQEKFLSLLDGKRSASEIADVVLFLVPSFELPFDFSDESLSFVPVSRRLKILERIKTNRPLSDSMKRDILTSIGKRAIMERDATKPTKSGSNRRGTKNSYPVCIRVDENVWNEVRTAAERLNVSISSLVIDSCKKYLDLDENSCR